MSQQPMLRPPENRVPVYGNIEVLLEPYHYLLQVPGKGMRSAMIKAFNQWLNIPQDEAIKIAKIVQALHTSSLLIDDIQDNSKLRRGIPATHLVYGVPWTINCGNLMYFKAMDMCTELQSPRALHFFIEEMVSLHKGQGFDIYWRDCNTCPTEEEYIQMVVDKTGGLFRLAIRLMSCYSERRDTDRFIPLVNNLGLWFQIRDDLINLQSEKYMQGKSFCEDLTEGKFSFPIIHAIRSNPSDRRLLNILQQRTEEKEIKKYAVYFMAESGSFEYTKQKLRALRLEIMQQIQELGGNVALQKIIDNLNDFENPDPSSSSSPQKEEQERPKPALRLSSSDASSLTENPLDEDDVRK